MTISSLLQMRSFRRASMAMFTLLSLLGCRRAPLRRASGGCFNSSDDRTISQVAAMWRDLMLEWRHSRQPSGHPMTSHLAENLKRSEEHTSELQSLMRISYAVFCLKKKKHTKRQ